MGKPKSRRTHELKCWPFYFDAVWRGLKTFEFRRNDRGFAAGDEVLLREWSKDGYTGREIRAGISYIAESDTPELGVGIPAGYAILALKIVRFIESGRRLEAVRHG